jgi:hypothetical protein
MDLSSRFSAALAAVSPELVADNGYCALAVDARLVLHVALDEATGDVVLWSNFPLLSGGEALMQRLLHANFFWQGTFGASWSIDPATAIPMLAERVAATHWDGPVFDGLLQRFADRAMAWETELGSTPRADDHNTVCAPFSSDPFDKNFLRA